MQLNVTDRLMVVESFSATTGQAIQCATRGRFIHVLAESGVLLYKRACMLHACGKQNPDRASADCPSPSPCMGGRLVHGQFGTMYRKVACRLRRHSNNCFMVRASFQWSLLGSPQQAFCSTRLGRRPPRTNNVPAAQQSQTTTVELGQQQSYKAPSVNGSQVVLASGSLTFQEAIARLQEYWSSLGCAIWQPHNTEVRSRSGRLHSTSCQTNKISQLLAMQVGAGTMNPATFLRVAGPEEWRVCYIEPSARPDDSRYGENPNRLQQHTQMQVRHSQMMLQANANDVTTVTHCSCRWS